MFCGSQNLKQFAVGNFEKQFYGKLLRLAILKHYFTNKIFYSRWNNSIKSKKCFRCW